MSDEKRTTETSMRPTKSAVWCAAYGAAFAHYAMRNTLHTRRLSDFMVSFLAEDIVVAHATAVSVADEAHAAYREMCIAEGGE